MSFLIVDERTADAGRMIITHRYNPQTKQSFLHVVDHEAHDEIDVPIDGADARDAVAHPSPYLPLSFGMVKR